MKIKKKTLKLAVLGALALAVVFIAGFWFMGSSSDGITGNVVGSSDTFKIPISDITSEATFYDYKSGGTTISFFVVKASDGTIKTGFDACDVCFNQHKGYRQEGDNMICNNCGNKYAIDGLGTENKNGGGCWPGYLPMKIVGDEVVIYKKDLDDGKGRF